MTRSDGENDFWDLNLLIKAKSLTEIMVLRSHFPTLQTVKIGEVLVTKNWMVVEFLGTF